MLRPERMSRVSVTGSKHVMGDVIEAVHGLHLVHLLDYDGSWEGFAPGDPMAGADEAADQLVTVRSIEAILDIDDEDVDTPPRIDEAFDEELERIRAQVNELDDRRNELRDQLRTVDEREAAIDPFVALGIDLDLLSGYDTITVRVGQGDADAVTRALAASPAVEEYETFAADDTVAAFVYSDDPNALDEALVGVDFTALEVPDADGSPREYGDALAAERREYETDLDAVAAEIEDLKREAAGFILAAEERLTIEVQKTEAPLQFATTENAFIAEGWIPTDRYPDLESTLQASVGDHVAVEELERADYDPPHEHGETHGHVHGDESREEVVAADGGTTMGSANPPVVQNNPSAFKPFELLVETINRPRYFEFDPTAVLFLTFPVFFGFMIGDLGYGILYAAIGYWLYSSFDSDAIRSLGGIAIWSGAFTMLFGVLYGEFFGLHQLGALVWGGHPPIEKGLAPASVEYAQAWLVIVLLAGLVHMTIGYVFDFVQNLSHGVADAVLESGSWIILMAGVWAWVFSRHLGAAKPSFLFEVFAGEPFALGFHGLSPAAGLGGLGLAAIGLVLLLLGEGGIGLLESLNVVVNVLSYARIAAVLLAKAGMAFVVNLLFFGVYAEGNPAEYHFMISHGPAYVVEHSHEAEIVFPGLIHSGIVGVLGGIVILVVGHLLVLALGITSAGLQAVRLEYVEFFGKFYEGGGEAYEPFGYDGPRTAGE